MIPLRDTKRSGRFPLITVLLIVLNVVFFGFELFTPNIELFLFRYALIPKFIQLGNPGTWYPFVTAMFIHGGFLHVVTNMLFLWVFGDNVEDRFGWWYLPIYLLGGIIGNVAQYLAMPHSILPIVGASGAVATVLGAYIIISPGSRVLTLVPILFLFTVIEIPAVVVLAYWFFLQILNGVTAIGHTTASMSGGVAYFAHIAGFVSGVALALLWRSEKRLAH